MAASTYRDAPTLTESKLASDMAAVTLGAIKLLIDETVFGILKNIFKQHSYFSFYALIDQIVCPILYFVNVNVKKCFKCVCLLF